MWTTLFRKHCSEETLVAYLDGELPLGSDLNVRRHLQSCWKCRLRLADMEQRILQMTKLFTDEVLLEPGRVAEARQKIETSMRAARQESGAGTLANGIWASLWGPKFSTAAGLLVLASIGAASYLIITPRKPAGLPEPFSKQPVLPASRSAGLASIPDNVASPAVPAMTSPVDRTIHSADESSVLLQSELQAFYALHLAGACRTEPVEVLRSPNGIEIRGVVSSLARKERIEEFLNQTGGSDVIKVALMTVEEAVAKSSPTPVPERQDAVVRQTRLPIEDLAAPGKSYANQLQVDQRTLAASAQEAVTLAEEALSEAFALRRLAERFGKDSADLSTSQVGPMLAVMVRDHMSALHQQIGRCNRVMRPVLGAAALSGQESAELAGRPIDEVMQEGWSEAAEELLRDVQAWHSLVHGLFAGAGLGQLDAAEAARLLSGSMPRLEEHARLLENEMLRDLPSRRPTSASRRLQD